MSRRRLFRVGAGLAGAALVGCAAAPPKPSAPAQAPQAAGTTAPPVSYPAGSLVPIVKGTPKYGGTWTEATAEIPTEHDAHTTLTNSPWMIPTELAIKRDPWTAELSGNIIESWEVPNSTTFLLKVRRGVKIHNKPPWNGREFDAEDLAFNISRIAGNTAAAENIPLASFQRAATLLGLKSTEVVDKYTVKVTLSSPNAGFLHGFAEHRNLLMPKGIVEVGFKEPMKFAGVSAFQISEWTPSVREVYTKAPNYFRSGEPYFDKLVRVAIPDRAAITAGFISKQLSTLTGPTLTEEKVVQAARPDALLYRTEGNQLNNIRLNLKHGALGDFRVRKALQLAINYQDLMTAVGPGANYLLCIGAANVGAWSSDKVKSLPGYNPDTKEKDRAEAAKLLAAAGRTNGKGVDFDIMPSFGSVPYRENALRIQDQMAKVFPEMKIKLQIAADGAQFSRLQSTRNFQAISYTVGPQSDMVAESHGNYHSKGVRNYGSFENAEADALLEKLVGEFSVETRKQMYETFQQKYLNEWMPLIMLYTPALANFLQPNIGGFHQVVGPWSQRQPWGRAGALYEVA